MSFDADHLLKLLPAVYRLRDAEQGGPLQALLAVLAEQAAVLEEDLAQLHDDQFVETCAAWVLPYLGDLVGVRGLQGIGPAARSPRAEVAHTIGYRRRKGTAAVLEQLARDVTGWPARAVEFFQLLATTQYLNHRRPENRSFLPVRDAGRLERLGGPFEHLAGATNLTHTADVRRIAGGRGRYNIPNVGLFLWRLRAYSLTRSLAVQAALGDSRRFLFSPLGHSAPLFSLPETEDEITHLAEPVNVPEPIRRRVLANDLADYYGAGKSFFLTDGNGIVAANRIRVCDLSDQGSTWAHLPTGPDAVALDPVLGRVAFSQDQAPPPLVTFHYGFSADLGGGEYDRAATDFGPSRLVRVPGDHQTVQDALADLGTASGVVEITDSDRYVLLAPFSPLDLAGRRVAIRAAAKRRPTLVLRETWQVSGADGELTLDGLLLTGDGLAGPPLAGAALHVTGGLARLRLRHCTLVPGVALRPDGAPVQPATPSLHLDTANARAEIDHCILGGLRVAELARVHITHSIVDATAPTSVAYAAPGPDEKAGGLLRVENSTVLGKVHAAALELASNTLFLAGLAAGDTWPAPVRVRRRQEGCVRFSYVPPGSRVPRRYRCQPADGDNAVRPLLTSQRYGDAAYCQLSARCTAEIRRGADDEAEMGAFHDLYQPQREAHLRARLDEYLRFGLEAGVFYVT